MSGLRIVLQRLVGRFTCPACRRRSIGRWCFVQRPVDGLHDRFKLCCTCRRLPLATLQPVLYVMPNANLTGRRK